MFTLAFHGATRAVRLALKRIRTPSLVPLLGTLVSVDFIRPRPISKRVTCGHLSMDEPAWSSPFWSTMIFLEDGTYIGVDLDPLCTPPHAGQLVSMVGRRRLGKPLKVVLMLRPAARLAKHQ